jgi:hypothetical protein
MGTNIPICLTFGIGLESELNAGVPSLSVAGGAAGLKRIFALGDHVHELSAEYTYLSWRKVSGDTRELIPTRVWSLKGTSKNGAFLRRMAIDS